MEAEQEKKAKEIVYNKIKKRLSLLEIGVELGLLLFFVFSPYTARIAQFAQSKTDGLFLQFFIFAAILAAVFYGVGLLFSFYSSYIIEKDFDLSNQTVRGWAFEQLKVLLITVIIGAPVAWIFYATLIYGGAFWWFYFATAIVILSVILAKLAPILLFPLFYTFIPVEDEALPEKIMKHLDGINIRIQNIYIFNFSKTTKKANAAFTGMGKTKRIILSDTLVDNFSQDEIAAVFAHEVGHLRYRHIQKLIFFSTVINYAAYFICAQLYDLYLRESGLDYAHSLTALPMLMLLLMLFSLFAMPVTNAISRKYEWEADRYALAHQKREDYSGALEKLADLNVADRNLHPLYEWFFYSHPAITKRINYAKEYNTEEQTR